MLYTLFFAGYHFPSPANIGVERMCFLIFAGSANRFARFFAKNLSWNCPGDLLEALGGQDRKSLRGTCFFGPSWGRLGRLLARLGGLYWPSGSSWRPLEPVLDPSWRPKSDLKSLPRCIFFWIIFLMRFSIDFGSIFDGFWTRSEVRRGPQSIVNIGL